MIKKGDIQRALRADYPPTYDNEFGGDNLREAAVLIALHDTPQGVKLLLTKRALHLNAHPGQISFPGGRKEAVDQNATQCALREAWEETGLPPDVVMPLGEMPVHNTFSGFEVTPVVGWISDSWTPNVDENEVSEVFFVPFDHLLDLSNYAKQSRPMRGLNITYNVIPYGPYYIWGATAHMLRNFAERFV
ncbi:MAG: NUDIX hydrolase [Planktomarina sp.]